MDCSATSWVKIRPALGSTRLDTALLVSCTVLRAMKLPKSYLACGILECRRTLYNNMSKADLCAITVSAIYKDVSYWNSS
jgi:hypothetical protein